MQKNVGNIDKIIRVVVGLLLAVYALFMRESLDTLGWIALIVGVVLLATGFMNFCPMYRAIGMSTKKD